MNAQPDAKDRRATDDDKRASDGEHSYPGGEARQGQIALDTPTKRRVFLAALIVAIAFAALLGSMA